MPGIQYAQYHKTAFGLFFYYVIQTQKSDFRPIFYIYRIFKVAVTRRLFARPSAVLLVSIGFNEPAPIATT